MPADQIERVVREGINRLLNEPSCLRDALGVDLSAQQLEKVLISAKRLVTRLEQSGASAWRKELSGVLQKIVLHAESMSLHISPMALMSWLHESDSQSADFEFPESWRVDLPCQLTRRGKQVRIVINAPDRPLKPEPDPSLLKLLQRAHYWRDQMEGAQETSIETLAKQNGVNASYFTRVARLAYLAPDIVEAIVDGQQPAGLTTTSLARAHDLPIQWDAQRRRLGFPPA